MTRPKELYRTTIIVWSSSNPLGMEASQLVREGEVGDAYISRQITDRVTDPSEFPNTEFFDLED